MVFVQPNYRFFHVFCPLCIKVDSFGTVCYLFHDCSRTLQDSFMECYSTKYFSEKYCGCIQIFFDCVYTNIIIMSLLVRKQRATLYKLLIVELWFFISLQIFIGQTHNQSNQNSTTRYIAKHLYECLVNILDSVKHMFRSLKILLKIQKIMRVIIRHLFDIFLLSQLINLAKYLEVLSL